MLVPLSWLREFAPFDHPVAALTEALSNLGLVVDGVKEIGGDLDGVEVVRILAVRTHPNADRMCLVDVDRGDGQPLQVACGATNMAAGDLVALATPGSVLPGGREITRAKKRGEWSNGMLCSAVELGLPDDGADGLAILAPGSAAPGTLIAIALAISPDVVFDLDITPNRPDALSIAGVARDLAAALDVPFAIPTLAPRVDPAVEAASVMVEDRASCPRLTGTVVTGVTVGPSPAWLVERLALAGTRSINNVVDVSNYVMLHLGQPNHAYDLDRLGGRGLVARRGRAGETLTTLDGVSRHLGPDDCVIADAEGLAVGIGGIMGGEYSEISPSTTTVLVEAAYFDPMAIARTGKRLGLHSEARSRYERGIDPEGADAAVDLFVALLTNTVPISTVPTSTEPTSTGPATVRRGPTTDIRAELRPATVVSLRTSRVNALLGVDLDDGAVAGHLRPLGFDLRSDGAGIHEVTVPTWRPDVTREVDLVEEVARLYGYSRITRTVPTGARTAAGLTSHQRKRRAVRDILAGAGLEEAWTTTFLAPGDLELAGLPAEAVEVENPLDSSESILRTSMLPGLLKAVRFNADRQQTDVRLFEIGRTFALPLGEATVPQETVPRAAVPQETVPRAAVHQAAVHQAAVPRETEMLAVIVAGTGADGRLAAKIWAVLARALRLEDAGIDAGDVAGLHPTRSAVIRGSEGATLGAVGEVDPAVSAAYGLTGRVGWVEVDLVALFAERRHSERARPTSRFPASDIDLAFVVDMAVPAADVESTLRVAGGDMVESVALFDVYRADHLGPQRRSLAYRLRFRAGDRTLTDAELAQCRQEAINAVVATHGSELRT